MNGPSNGQDQTSGTTPPSGDSAYQLTLAGLVLPLPFHIGFNLLALVGLLLLRHPVAATLGFLASCATDLLFQRTVARLTARAPAAETPRDWARLALLCAGRVSVYLVAPVVAALAGGKAELALLVLVVTSMVAVACASGSLSRAVFWSFASPPLLAVSAVVCLSFPPPAAAGLMISIACLTLLLALISYGATKAIAAWQQAYATNLALISELEAARDRAVAERTAADEAREAARRANRAKSAFLATMSHEIRTPMNGVLGMAQLLKREEADPLQTERLGTLIESGEHLLSILNDILDVSKIDAGRLDITPAVEDLPLLLDRLIAFWGAHAAAKGVTLRLETSDDLPRFVWMDAVRVRQVLFNLVGNALKFTDAGSVVVGVTAQPAGEDRVRLRFSVTDTGPGIPDEHLPSLFERFSQVDESEERKFGGAGLGLAIAKQLTELMGGRIWVESEVGVGSAFLVEAVFDLAPAPAAIGAEPAEEEEDLSGDGLDLLIVDDNAVNLLVLEQILAAFGHRVEKAADGQSALDLLAARPFDLALMDIQMPGMTGVEALQRLRAAPGPNQAIPVVALTADVTSGGRAHYVSLGFTDHSAKPIQIPELLTAVARAVRAAPAE